MKFFFFSFVNTTHVGTLYQMKIAYLFKVENYFFKHKFFFFFPIFSWNQKTWRNTRNRVLYPRKTLLTAKVDKRWRKKQNFRCKFYHRFVLSCFFFFFFPFLTRFFPKMIHSRCNKNLEFHRLVWYKEKYKASSLFTISFRDQRRRGEEKNV